MPHSHLPFFEMLAQDFCDNRIEAVADRFVVPMPLYARGDVQVFTSTRNLTQALSKYRRAVQDAGLNTVKPRIIAEGLPVHGYSNVWVEWDHLDDAGQCRRVSQVHYAVFQDVAAQQKIELVDYKLPAFPEVADSLAMVATA